MDEALEVGDIVRVSEGRGGFFRVSKLSEKKGYSRLFCYKVMDSKGNRINGKSVYRFYTESCRKVTPKFISSELLRAKEMWERVSSMLEGPIEEESVEDEEPNLLDILRALGAPKGLSEG